MLLAAGLQSSRPAPGRQLPAPHRSAAAAGRQRQRQAAWRDRVPARRSSTRSSSGTEQAPGYDGMAAAQVAAAPGQEVLQGAATMEEAYDVLTARIQRRLVSRGDSPQGPLIVGVAGGPGSGKSSLARAVCARLEAAGVPAVNVPMDGFHYYRRQLDSMPDPALAHARRGAEWTFDARAYVQCLSAIRATGEARAPSFDHGVGDPVEGDIAVGRHHAVVLSEGNYLLLGAEPWWQVRALLDEAWFVHCSVDEAMRRVYERQTGHGVAPEVSRWRVAANDRPNAEQVHTTARHASLLVPTLPLGSKGD